MYYIIFEKVKSHDGTINRTKNYAEAAVRSDSLKKTLWEIPQNSQESICAGISLLVFSCEFFEICKNTFFAEQHL